jgi:diacylglycerol kinase (ATP)
MTAIALLHPDVSPKIVDQFRSSGVELIIGESLGEKAGCTAGLIFGGDGTVHRHLPEICQQNIPMLVVPVGSGNDFAKAIGIFRVGDALQAWQQFCADGKNVWEIDLGVIKACAKTGSEVSRQPTAAATADSRAGVSEILFCCVAGVGMDAEANRRANNMPAWLKGKGGYLLAALEALVAFQPVEMSVMVDGREIRRTAFFAAVGNAQSYGGGMKVTPRARPDDGLLDVCVVSKMNKLKLLCWVPTIFFGGHLRLKQVEYFQTRSVRIEAARELDLYADGDFVCPMPVEISLRPRALRVIVPGPPGKRAPISL